LLALLPSALIELSTGQSLPNAPISTLGFHLSLSLTCHSSSLTVVAPLAIPSVVLVRVRDCEVTSGLDSGALFSVLGSLVVENCVVQNAVTRILLVFGSLHLENFMFRGNSNSIITALVVGLTVLAVKCDFEDNSAQ